MIKRLVIALVLLMFVLLTAFGQSEHKDLILNIKTDTLIHNIHNINSFEKETEISEIKNLYKLSIWHFAPGISYDFIRNRYYLTISTSGLVTHFANKKVEKRRLGSIERKYKARDLGDEFRVSNLVMGIEKDYQDLILAKKVVDIEIEIFIIQQQQYKENEIDTEKYLTSKKNIINSIKQHNNSVTNLYKQILNLSSICNTTISADLSELYFTIDFIED